MQFLPVQWFDSLPSTNAWLRERMAEGGEPPPSGTVVAAREQTAGRGRFDRQWVATPGRDLAFSFLIHTAAPRAQLPSLAMAVALGVADALDAFHLHPMLKWPNDVLIRGQKICGILAESVSKPGSEMNSVVVGVGLNVNMDAETAARIPKPATSVRIELGRTTPVELMLQGLLLCIETWIELWEANGFDALRQEWLTRGVEIGAALAVEDHGRRIEGAVAGYGDHGELLLQDATDTIHVIASGDATVLGSE